MRHGGNSSDTNGWMAMTAVVVAQGDEDKAVKPNQATLCSAMLDAGARLARPHHRLAALPLQSRHVAQQQVSTLGRAIPLIL